MYRSKNLVLLKDYQHIVNVYAREFFADSGVLHVVLVIPAMNIIDYVHQKSREEVILSSKPAAITLPVRCTQVLNHIYTTMAQTREQVLYCGWNMFHVVTAVI
jgi:hypothetical protein